MTFCKRVLHLSGIWPLEIRDSLFILFIIYGCLYNILALLDLMTYIKNFRNVIVNIMENMLVLMTLSYRIYLGPLVKPYNVKSYAFGCIHEFLRTIMIISDYLSTDSFFASIGFHFTSRFAILKCKVENVLNNTDDPRQGIRKIILGHHRLISLLIEIFFFNFERYECVERYEILADLFENSFNIVIRQYLFGTTILLCISLLSNALQFSNHRNSRYNDICCVCISFDVQIVYLLLRGRISPRGSPKLVKKIQTLGIDSLANRILFFQRYTLITNTPKAITWSKRLHGYSGIWPLKVRDSLFPPYLFYGFVYSILGFLDLTDFITDFHYVLRNIMENMLIFMTLTKFGVCRMKCQPLSKFLTETENDYIIDNYKTKEERLIFMKYNKIASKFIVITFPWMTLVLLLHYFKAVIPNIFMAILPLLKPYDAKSYAFGCTHQFFGITLVLSGYVGTDCLLACTGFHLIGQLAILKCRVKKLLKNIDDSHGRIRQMILRHYRSTILLCTSSYQMLFVRIPLFYANLRLTFLTELERVYRFTFLIYVCLLSCKLYGLIKELINRILIDLQFDITNLCDAIYHCDWYELSTINLKFLCICMVRAKKPLRLTCAKFHVVSLCTFTDVSRCIGYVRSVGYNRIEIPYVVLRTSKANFLRAQKYANHV
ncbi:odorant receptor 13a-like isoform X2 [Vespula squamosa]|uniref:Odorant receptor 13a-like isoform X2 n=1 Tax=Vespula squamosa TaxID=30214 RepID=A0ABD2BHL4_VESSQ